MQCQVPCVFAERSQKCLRTPMSNQLMNQLQRSTRCGCVDWDFSLFIKAHSGNQLAIEVLELSAESRHSWPRDLVVVME
ncbi:hypothetical protein ALP87_101892 [Pseudomonas syringae pv. coriandricola]|nr:hypothetical protein ALP87_101892 [Pseudomonas syringae pv. coriandricola]